MSSKLRPLGMWLRELGIKPGAGYLWRKRGYFTAINIGGRLFISDAEIARFNARAEAGEFYKKIASPKAKKPQR